MRSRIPPFCRLPTPHAPTLPCAAYLVSAGWTLDVWDLNTAQQLHSLVAPPCGEEDDSLGLANPDDASEAFRFTSVSYCGNLMAAGEAPAGGV